MAARTDRPNAGIFRRQLIAMLDDETADRIEAEAAQPGRSKAGVIRHYIELGIEAEAAQPGRSKAGAKASALAGPGD